MAVDKRRRKKARIQQESSSESDDSSSHESVHDSPSELSDFSDDEPVAAATETAGLASTQQARGPRERLHKAPHHSAEEFKQVFLKMVTDEFGEELAGLREANDFAPTSIAQLVAGLKQGVDVFTEDQQRRL